MTTGLEALRAAILDDPILAQPLDAAADPQAFAVLAQEAARSRGLTVSLAALQETPAPIERDAAPPGWLPDQVVEIDGQAVVTWRWLGQRRLAEPFYADDLMIAGYRPLNRLIPLRTPLPSLGDHPPRAPDGLVFHMSRCGSTLAARMLAASSANVVISEASPLEAVLRLDLNEDAKVEALRAMIAALGQSRNGETRLFLKLDCWQVRDLPLFRRAFPETPWAFLYREPVEVLVSHQRRRGVQMIPELLSPARLGLPPQDVPDEDYCARVLAAVCEGAITHHALGGGLLVNYRNLPEALFDRILPHFGWTPSEDELAAMRAAGGRNAKAPDQAFVPDSQAKRQAADAARGAICDRRIGPAYRRLEAMRAAEA